MNSEPYITDFYKSEKTESEGPVNLTLFVENQLFMFAVFNENFTSVNELCHAKINTPGTTSLTDKLTFLLNNYRLLQKDFKSINVCILNNNFSLTPEAFVLNENVKDVLHFTGGADLAVKNSYVHKFDQVNFCYSIPGDLVHFIERSFKKAAIRHAGAVTIDLLFSNPSLKNCDLFLNFNSGVFELAAKENNKLLYYNGFNFETNEDVLYYLLFMMEQYKFNPLTCRLVIAGQLDTNSELSKSIKKYIKQVSFAVNDKSFTASFAGLNLPEHYFFSLVNQHLCAL